MMEFVKSDTPEPKSYFLKWCPEGQWENLPIEAQEDWKRLYLAFSNNQYESADQKISPDKRPLLSDINERNKSFWDKTMIAFEERIRRRPGDLERAISNTQRMISAGLVSSAPSIEKQVLDFQELENEHICALAQERAKRPRPRSKTGARKVLQGLALKYSLDGRTAAQVWDHMVAAIKEGRTDPEFETDGYDITVEIETKTTRFRKSSFGTIFSKVRQTAKH